jgi:hypothetical protein
MRTLASIIAFLAGAIGTGLVLVVLGVLASVDEPYTVPKWVMYAGVGTIFGAGWWAAEWAKTRFAPKGEA